MAKKTGIEFIFGYFGSGKTVYQTKILKFRHKRKKELTSSTYWTVYTDIPVRSREDITRLWWDVYKYHKFIRYYYSMDSEEYDKKSPEYFKERDEFLDYLRSLGIEEKDMNTFDRITLSMDEGSVYFNNEHYASVFKGENEKLLTLLYQPRKIRMDFLIGVQSPNEIHVKFRRLGTDWHYFERIFFFWRRYITFYVLEPETFKLDPMSIKEISRHTSFNWFVLVPIINFFLRPFKRKFTYFTLRYNTDEVVERDFNVYEI